MSANTSLLYGHIRRRVLDFDPAGPDAPLRTTLGERLYTLEPPDNASYPFATQRLRFRATGTGDDSRLREQSEIVFMVYGRPRASLSAVERIADIIEESLLHYSTPDIGLMTMRGVVSRETLSAYQSPENREIVQVRLVLSLTWWPTYRSQLATASGAPAP
jgi:hypothetical protein